MPTSEHDFVPVDASESLSPCRGCGRSQHQHGECLFCRYGASDTAHCAWCGENSESTDALLVHLGGKTDTSPCWRGLSRAPRS